MVAGPAVTSQPESWGAYPEPHYDEDDNCQCPDHVAQRIDRDQYRILERWLTRGT